MMLAKAASPDFVVPGQKKVSGVLLDLNYKPCQSKNRKAILSDAPTICLVLLGDDTYIHHMPLINCLSLCGDIPPV